MSGNSHGSLCRPPPPALGSGINVTSLVEFAAVRDFQKLFEVNVFGIVRVSKAFIPALRQTQGRTWALSAQQGDACAPSPSMLEPNAAEQERASGVGYGAGNAWQASSTLRALLVR